MAITENAHPNVGRAQASINGLW